MSVDIQCHAPAALSPEKSAGTHCTGRWMSPSVGQVGCGGEKNLFLLLGLEWRTAQPVASRYTDYTTPSQ
jgi:hypothetical protein